MRKTKVPNQEWARLISSILPGILVFTALQCVLVQRLYAFDPIVKGETIAYDIKKFKITVGDAKLVYNGIVEVNQQETLSITFTATGFKFFDEEQIFLDPVTFNPILIKRNLDIFGKKENIIEYYDADKGKIRIVNYTNGKAEQKVIERGDRFDNIYGFIYRQRLLGKFTPKETYDLHLPTQDVQFRLMDNKNIEINNNDYEVFYIASEPQKFKVWFDRSPRKIPLKIDGAIGWGNMSMVIKE